jgi:formylglycine-generating enzyme required for sulfatase activity
MRVASKIVLFAWCGLCLVLYPGVGCNREPERVRETWVNSIGMKFVQIPNGTFTMGSPPTELGRFPDETLHDVTITQDFYLGVFEVTVEQFSRVMGEDAESHYRIKMRGDLPEQPVRYVSFELATEFCRRLSELPAEKNAGRVYRLPTEAEWEYACRAGSTTAYVYGDSKSSLGDYAWFNENSVGVSHPVGQKRPNAWGLYDMHGNVWECCSDWYGEYPAAAVNDPQGPRDAMKFVLRGGANDTTAAYCRSATRRQTLPIIGSSTDGLRVALSLSNDRSSATGSTD